ncbi:MAG TPA: DUF2079 domain-containing protein, partial [Chroococcidiopsis sp.]
MAVFDQWIYLLSRDLPPISSLIGFHVLGDHAALILYPISLLYRLYPSIQWLFLVQAIAFAAGAIPIYALSLQVGLTKLDARAIALCYVLYPALFNSNFYADFRPEAIAVPALLWALWAGVAENTLLLAVAVIVVLSCKDTLGLTVFGLGLWFWLSERQRLYGIGCMIAGAGWFWVAIHYLIPLVRPGAPRGLWFFESLGTSMSAVLWALVSHPQELLLRLAAPDRLFYYLLLVLPVLLGLYWKHALTLIPALPMLLLNVLSDYPSQRDLIHQYALPIVPFVLLWLVRSLAHYRQNNQRRWLSPKWLVTWAAIAFLALGKYSYFYTQYRSHLSNAAEVYAAIDQIPPAASVLTVSHLCAHLSHRITIQQLSPSLKPDQLTPYSEILLDMRHPGRDLNPNVAKRLKTLLESRPDYQVTFNKNDVIRFSQRRPSGQT